MEVSNNAYDGKLDTVPLKDFAGNEVLPAVQSSSYSVTNNTPIGPPATLTAEAGDGRVRLVLDKPGRHYTIHRISTPLCCRRLSAARNKLDRNR